MKRRRVTSTLQREETPDKGSSTTQAPFLKHFDDTNPIAVILTPLRKSQASILSRNLQQAGARVITEANEFHNSEIARNIVIVTDDRSKANLQIGEHLIRGDQVKFVSTKWASAVLRARRHIPFGSFDLSEPVSPSKEVSEQNRDPWKPDTKVSSMPVWCRNSVTASSDISLKNALLKQLPSLQCERATMTEALYPTPNARLSRLLEQVAKKRLLEEAGGSENEANIRARAYRRASAALKCVPFRIQTAEDVHTLETFGPRVLSAAREFVHTGRILEADFLKTDARLRTLSELTQLYGVGVKTARYFYDELNIKSVADLQLRVAERSDLFKQPFVSFLSHLSRFRPASLDVAIQFRDAVDKIANGPEDSGGGVLNLRFVLCGGFRRGEREGHDIDLVYCRKGIKGIANKDTTSNMSQLRERLLSKKILKHVLHESSNMSSSSGRKYGQGRNLGNYDYAHDIMHAIGEWEGYFYRIDIVGVRDVDEMAFATLAWSGSTAFQRDFRMATEKYGWVFNDHGFFDRQSGNRADLDPWPTCEMDIFHAIHLIYRPPFERSS